MPPMIAIDDHHDDHQAANAKHHRQSPIAIADSLITSCRSQRADAPGIAANGFNVCLLLAVMEHHRQLLQQIMAFVA
jgi:hypothetical protein